MIFKGVVSWIASFMITYLAFTMLQFSGWEEKWRRKLDIIASKQLKQEQNSASKATEPQQGLSKEDGLPIELVDLESVPEQTCQQREPEVKEKFMSKYAFFIAIFLTVVREGLESVVFLAGVGNSLTSRE